MMKTVYKFEMKTIYKYELEITGEQTLEMPSGAMMLHLGVQGNTPVLWALVDPTCTTPSRRTFETFGTGHKIPLGNNRQYIGSYQIQNQPGARFVGHVFEKL